MNYNNESIGTKIKNFFIKWKKGIGMITDVQLIESKLAGHKGVIIAMLIIQFSFVKRLLQYSIGSDEWIMNLGFIFMFIFFIFLQYNEIRTGKVKIKRLIEEKKEFELEEK